MRKGTWMVVLVLGWLFGPPSNVQKASEAYQAKRFKEAVALFAGEMPNYPGQQSGLNFNQAQCWMLMDSNSRAMSLFGNCTQSYAENRQVASWSWNQIGTLFASGKGPKAQQPTGSQPGAANPGMQPGMDPMMGANPGMSPMMGGAPAAGQQQTMVSREELQMALQAFKDALKLDHDNEVARYNYELVKRKLQQQDQNQNQDQNQDQQQQQEQQQQQQQQQDQQNKPKPQPQENKGNQQQQQQQGEGKDPMEMSMEEAERILAAMNSNEKKFLQQLERGKKHKTYNDDGPNW